jgi:hypothetical protein
MPNYIQQGSKVSLKDAVLFIKTCSTTVNSGVVSAVALKFGSGDVSWQETDSVEYATDRGRLDDVREGDESPLSVTFSGTFTHALSISAGTEPITPYEVLRANRINAYHTSANCADFVGYAEPWLISAGGCPPYATELELHINPRLRCPLNSTIQGDGILFRYFRTEEHGVSISSGEFNVSGKCNVLIPTFQRTVFTYTSFSDAEPLAALSWDPDPRIVT